MTVTFVKSAANTGTGSVVLTFASATTSGNAIVIGVIGPTSYATLSGFTAVQEPNNGSTNYMTLLYGTSTGQTSITVTSAGASQAIAYELTGNAASPFNDFTGATANSTTGTTIVSPSITTTNKGDMLVGIVGSSATTLAQSSWSNFTASGSETKLLMGYYAPGTTLSGYTTTFTATTSKIMSSIYIAVLAAPPTVTTLSATNITSTSATLNGTITSTGGATITYEGFFYSNSTANPGILTPGFLVLYVTPGGGTGSFSISATSLTPNTTYYVSAFAQNSNQTSFTYAYGFQSISFKTANLLSLSLLGLGS
jgi:hypothetical protein